MLISREYCRPLAGPAVPSRRARIALGNNAQFVFVVIQNIRNRSGPGALPITFRKGPELVASVVDPWAVLCESTGGTYLPLVLRIDEQVAMSTKLNLHQPAAELGNECQAPMHPA